MKSWQDLEAESIGLADRSEMVCKAEKAMNNALEKLWERWPQLLSYGRL